MVRPEAVHDGSFACAAHGPFGCLAAVHMTVPRAEIAVFEMCVRCVDAPRELAAPKQRQVDGLEALGFHSHPSALRFHPDFFEIFRQLVEDVARFTR